MASVRWEIATASVLALDVGMATTPVRAAPVCEGISADYVESLCGKDKPGPRGKAPCTQFERSFEALCADGFDTVYASDAAKGTAVTLLERDYRLMPIDEATPQFTVGHVVIGPPDLDDPDSVALVKEAYQADKTVAIANARQEDADAFHRLVRGTKNGANCTAVASSIDLYGLQQAISRKRTQISSYCLPGVAFGQTAKAGQWLRARFSLQPPAPPAPDDEQSASLGALPYAVDMALEAIGFAIRPSHAQSTSPNLADLARETHCSHLFTQPSGTSQADPYVASLRDFPAELDYYSVSMPLEFSSSVGGGGSFIPQADLAQNGGPALPGAELQFTEPATQVAFESSYTNSESLTVGASVGFNSDGPDVSVSASVTIGESTTVTVPPVKILNQADLTTAESQWTFTAQNIPAGTVFAPTLAWVWSVPGSAYPDGGTGDGSIVVNASPMLSAQTRPPPSLVAPCPLLSPSGRSTRRWSRA